MSVPLFVRRTQDTVGLRLLLISIRLVLGSVSVSPVLSLAEVTVQIGRNFEGSVERIDSQAVPPDANGAAGPRHFIELVNGRYSVYDKSTGERVQTKTDDTFWQDSGVTIAAGRTSTDPRTLYDATSGRWFAAAVDVSRVGTADDANRFLLAVSDTDNPLEGWHGADFQVDPAGRNFGDFPTLGIDSEGVYLSASLFSPTGRILGSTLYTIPRADLLAVPLIIDRRRSFGTLSFKSRGEILQPAVTTGNPTTGGVLLAVGSTGVDFNVHSNLFLTHIPDPADSSQSTLTSSISISVPPYTVPINPTQPDGSDNLDNGDARIGSMVRRVGDLLYAVHCVQIDDRSALQWYVANAVSGTLIQSGVITDPDLQFYYPSIAANSAGVVVIGFNGSSTNQFVSSYAVVGDGPAGQLALGSPMLLKAGRASYQEPDDTGISRWGDYSTTCVDPADANRFWTIQSIARDPSGWATQITEIIILPLRLSIVRLEPNIELSWPATAGARVQATESLTSPSWVNLEGQPTVAEGVATLSLPGSDGSRFYRLVRQ